MKLIDCLLSLPPASARSGREWKGPLRPAFVGADPPGRQLGSGGGTAALLQDAWRASGEPSFSTWLRASRKLMIHGSGQSRRLPAYAAIGKPLMPLPTCGRLSSLAPDMRLVDLQWQVYRNLFRQAPESYCLMVCCGDVLVHGTHPPPLYPETDVLIVGLQASPEEASNHGVLFCDNEDPRQLAYFLQKPSPEQIRQRGQNGVSYLDSGIWLFSESAVRQLLHCCGWDPEHETFPDGMPVAYEIYDRFALSLGRTPTRSDTAISSLSAGVLAIENSRFYHFGTNRSVAASIAQLAHPAERQCSVEYAFSSFSARPVIVNGRCDAVLPSRASGIWIENAHIGARWKLRGWHVLTGIPPNDWIMDCPEGACLDIMSLQDQAGECLRPYGFDDPFRGALNDPATLWMGRPFGLWLTRRNLAFEQAGLDPDTDIQEAALFPCLPSLEQADALAQWMMDDKPVQDDVLRHQWLRLPRVSAAALAVCSDIRRREQSRMEFIRCAICEREADQWGSLGQVLDFESLARFAKPLALDPQKTIVASAPPSLHAVHLAMFRSRLFPERYPESDAFQILRDLLVRETRLSPAHPTRNVLDDQIVWGRSPARLDLAGGWTDTPPYCLEHGGKVVNLAVDLNGQPPIQVFARCCREPHILLHSIDLGIRECITETAQLTGNATLGDGFAIARAAFRLAGFDPAFSVREHTGTLREQLKRDFDGGIELNMLAAIPKGSGLGTSSILAATILGTLSELCALNWSVQDLFSRTLTLEQMLSSGGGWQDQVGGLLGGVKLIETNVGISQKPIVRWLPDNGFREGVRDGRILLYYTGITRIARNILADIVRGIFLNDGDRLAIVNDIGNNADFVAIALQKQNWEEICEAVCRSWRLNQVLDSGTNPPEIQALLAPIQAWAKAVKLLGAGGGGYLLILAQDPEAGHRIREHLNRNPPNPRARFVSPSLSGSGLQITRS